MVVIKCFCHAVEMRCCCKEDKHVEDLMGAAPYVECAGIASLWPASLHDTWSEVYALLFSRSRR